ncbi:Hypothetical predicted protein [Mytilus galloprovincialis]|uniref:Mab-21-like nucleotidyltransferase domain-containing protein n=1 Tax=Mytilus galloprovincialis TaxID=29158 RepID=A0A8B6DJN6_MYTGA|nr:Hypothetical predicted protein [Mytilus galloprovincialis]
MDRNSKNKSNSSDENIFDMKKTTYWEIYGVKRFPYRGKRKFTPLLSQSLDGGMVISNDVFGLTISQFERMYEACLERRKSKEQWILNLRYPDKSSIEYFEYLENCTDYNKDHLPWIDPREHHLYEHLVNIVGSEIDIRKRHRLFIIIDMIFNSSGLGGYTQIFSGSLAEGLDLPGSDMDVMYVSKSAKIIQKEKNILIPVNGVYVMETDIDHPGFARLRQVATSKGKSLPEKCERCPTGSCTGKRRYLLTSKFLTVHMQENTCIHGPCISDIDQTIDRAFCIRSKYLPHNAMPWSSRHGRQWPPSFVIDRIVKYGCLLVPVGPKISSDDDSLWRISFSVAESNDTWTINYKYNVHSFMTVNERMTLATTQHVHYVQHSQLIPAELQLEVEYSGMNILPNVMSRCLRFLCYHHLGDISNRRQTLRDLYITVKDNLIKSINTVSNELTILAVCFEISGYKDLAYQCYEQALQCDVNVCPSAKARRLKLLEN